MKTHSQYVCERGAAHIVALWILAILIMIAVGLSHGVSSSLYLKRLLDDRAESRLVARDAVDLALGLINTNSFHDVEGADEFTLIFCGDLLGLRLQPMDLPAVPEDSLGHIRISDEQGRLNLNSASEDELARIPGIDENLAAGIMDWRDPDNSTRMGGAESAYYGSLAGTYRCKNLPFESVEELFLVKGTSSKSLEKARQYLTVFGDGRVNINNCDYRILIALGISEYLANRLVRFRSGSDGIEGTEDDRSFTISDSIEAQIERGIILDADEQNQIHKLVQSDRFCTGSRVVRIEAAAHCTEGTAKTTITTVVRLNDQRIFQILYWKES